jgi:hypothetical protein
MNPLMKRAAGAILKAAIIQTERCSHRAWHFVAAEENKEDGRLDPTAAALTRRQMSEKAGRCEPTSSASRACPTTF